MKRVFFSIILAAMLSMSLMAVVAADSTTVVTEEDIARQAEGTPPTKSWVMYTRAAGTGAFRSGPTAPPIGVGSLELVTTTGADKVYLFNYNHIGTVLGDIDAISYATYRSAGSAQQVAGLNMVIDFNGPDAAAGFSTLVFEPVYNTDQGSVVTGEWQDWDAYNGGAGKWWSTKAIPGVCAFDCFVP